MQDKTTKVLLALIAAGLWGNLMRPLVKPKPLQAQQREVAVTHDVLRARRLEIVNEQGKVTAMIEANVTYSPNQRPGGLFRIFDQRGGAESGVGGTGTGPAAVTIDTSGMTVNQVNGLSAISINHFGKDDSRISIHREKDAPNGNTEWIGIGHAPKEGSWLFMQGKDGKERMELGVDAKDNASLKLTNAVGKKSHIVRP